MYHNLETKKVNILIIDDDTDFLEWLETGLLIDNYKVFTATTAEDGVKILKNNKIHLIILDILLPDINGFEFIKKIKTDKDTQDIIIVAVTGVYKEAELKQKGYEAGADDFLTKPFSYNFLSVKIKKLLEKMSPYIFKETKNKV